MAAKKSAAGRPKPRAKANARKRLVPRAEARGLAASEVPADPRGPELGALAAAVEAAGGALIGAYREPLAGRPLLLASLPRDAIAPTPFQRDLSPTHAKRLAKKIEESGEFLDPVIVVRGADGGFWSPNGRHRLAAAKLLGMRQITALVSPDERLAYRILALNTEKAHNLKDRSLEVIRMARSLAAAQPKTREVDHAEELEGAELLTLGIVYERESRFAGGAYGSLLRKVDRFSDKPLAKSLGEREGWAAKLVEIDAAVKKRIAELEARGFRSPYLRNYVVARINPVRFVKLAKGEAKVSMRLPEALVRMKAALDKFDVASVRERDLALVAAAASEPS